VNKTYGTRNLVSERTIAAAGAALEVREIDRVVVAGHTHSEIIFEILGRKGELTPQQLLSRDKYLEGLAAYREQQWDEALRALNESLGAIPDDGPSMALLKRAESLKANPHPEIGTGRGTSTTSRRGGSLWRKCRGWVQK